MNLTNEKAMEIIKGLPMFQNILKKSEEHESMKNQRQSDINERLALLENHPAESSKQETEASASRAKIVKFKQAYFDALNEGRAIERRHNAERFQFETTLGLLENRLRRSAPQRFFDRLEEIEAEIKLNSRGPFSHTDINLETRVCTSQELRDAQTRAEELMREREEINRRILEEYGYGNEGE